MLKEIKTKESDKIITVLTSELGVITIYAKGAMRLKNKFHSSTGLFTYSEFVVFEGKSERMYQLNEANVKKVFYNLSDNVENISLAMYMSELVCKSVVPNEVCREILRLFLNCLYMLCEGKWSPLMTKAAFEMRLISDIGYRPYLVGCWRCSGYEKEIFLFNVEGGYIICPECRREYEKGCIVCESAVILALRYLVLADLEQMFSFKLKGYALVTLCKICQEYILNCTKESYKTLEFLQPIYNDLIEKEIEQARGLN